MKGKKEKPPKGEAAAGAGETGVSGAGSAGTPGAEAEAAGAERAQAEGTQVEAAQARAVGPDPAAEIARLRAREDELLRALAELQNVQRRRRQEMDLALAYAHEPLVRALLPVLDDLERAVAATAGREEDPLAAGVRIVLDQLRATLARDGLEAIRPANGAFDPELHDALMQRPSPGTPPHTVLEVVKPGYRYRGRVLRHAQVVVSEEGSPAAGEPAAGGAPAGGPAPARGPEASNASTEGAS